MARLLQVLEHTKKVAEEDREARVAMHAKFQTAIQVLAS
jgi:hypothetical protein